MKRRAALVVVVASALVACGDPPLVCGVFAYDEVTMTCECPPDVVELPDRSCLLPDGGIVFPPGIDAGPRPDGGEEVDAGDSGGAADGGADACVTRTFFRDGDGDGSGDAEISLTACDPPSGYVENDDDCDDDCVDCQLGGTEVCDDRDNDCDGAIDEGLRSTFYRDADEDAFGDPTMPTQACAAPAGYVDNDADCNDACTTCAPGGTEVCDGVLDEDCTLGVDNGCVCTIGTTRTCLGGSDVGECSAGTQTCDGSGRWGPCTGAVSPTAELCNSLDDDCDTIIDGPTAAASCGTVTRAAGTGCTAGTCLITSCVAGYGDCDSMFANGCETDVRTSLSHCGSCGAACGWSCGGTACDDPVEVVAGEFFNCVRLASGRVACWGAGRSGQLGNGTTMTVNDVPSLVLNSSGVGQLADIVDIDAGNEHACAITSGGNVLCWGANGSGQLGDGGTTPRSLPVLVVMSAGGPALAGVTQIATGRSHTCARRSDSRVFCWGAGTAGQLGNGAMTNRSYPVQVLGPGTDSELRALEVATGGAHSCARVSLGHVYCWGSRSGGALGTGETTGTALRPVQVLGVGGSGTLSGVVQFSLAGSRSCARRASDVVCWGSSDWGAFSSTPATVAGLGGTGTLNASLLSAGERHSCAVANAELLCTGQNESRQLGDGTSTMRATYARVLGAGVPLFGSALGVDTGFDHTCAIDAQRRIVCFGANEFGQIGVRASGSYNPTLAASPTR